MNSYKIVILVESTKRYVKALDFKLRRWKRREVFSGIVTHGFRQYTDGSWGECAVGSAGDEAFLAFVELLIEERNKGNLSIYSIQLYKNHLGAHEEIVV